MFLALAKKETRQLLLRYNKTFIGNGIPGHNIDPDLPEEEFCRLLNEALETGVPLPEEKVCMPPLPEGYVL